MNQHLTEEEVAICAEALERNEYNSLPLRMREHLFTCDECADEVLVVADIAEKFDFNLSSKNPGRDKVQRVIAWSVSIAAAAALILLVIDLNYSSDPETRGRETFIAQDDTPKAPETRDEPQGNDKESEIKANRESEKKTEKKPLIADNKKEENQTGHDENIPAASSKPEEGPVTSALPPSREEPADTLKFLACFEPDEELERLVTRYNGNLRDTDNIEVTSPLTVTSNDSSVTIKWKNPEKKRLIIEVLNNNGQTILEDETDDEQHTIKNLSGGLYYWKLISSNFDLLFCGRIVVE